MRGGGYNNAIVGAAANGHEIVVKLLLEKGVHPDSKDSDGKTPLSWAAEKGHEGVAQFLLDEDAVDVGSKDNSCWTPLSWAANAGQEAIVRLLLTQVGVDVDFRD